MKRSLVNGLGLAAAVSMVLTGCAADPAPASDAAESTGPVTVTMAGWGLATTPEFQILADTFHAANPDYTVTLREYDATNYDTQMIADLSAGSAPDIYVQKNLKNFHTYQSGGQLADVSDVSAELDGVNGLADYEVDGATYAVPYRQDAWYLFYNKDLFDAAGVAHPDGSWTWDTYADAATRLTTGLQASGSAAVGSYQHTWQSVVQSFALAQTPGADLFGGDYSYLAPYYERAVRLQEAGAAVDFGTATTNSLTYQAQFGTQEAAMMPMGSWFVATLIAQQAKGDAEKFNWGIAPAPQFSAATVDEPVTFADPTGLGINPAIDDEKMVAAKAFLSFVASEQVAVDLAEIGITPAVITDKVTEAYFATAGVPGDDLSRFAFTTHRTFPENPVSESTTAVQNILKDAHSSIMSGSAPIADALKTASDRVRSEVPTG